jgi:RNA polymerase sigma factor (sigma-70 family)
VSAWGRSAGGSRCGVARDPLEHPEEALRRLYAYVAYRIGPGAGAEDVASETIERALRYRASYDHRKGSPAAWLAGIAARVMVDVARANAGRTVSEPEQHQPPIEDFSGAALTRLDLQSAMGLLDERSRELLALRYGADLKAREIADLLEMRTNAVEVALSRALGRLRTILEGDTAASPQARDDDPAIGLTQR